MRWFVEVSRVGESDVAEEYCVEAKQWQAALQEVRKLRGDAGALSKFSIELLDRGYRAVDPSLKVRYLINEAPPEATLTSAPHSSADTATGRPRASESLPPRAFSTSVAPAATQSVVPRPGSLAPPAGSSVLPRPASVAPPRLELLVVPDPEPPAPGLPELPESPRASMPAPAS